MMRSPAAVLAAVAFLCVMNGAIARPEPGYTALSASQEALSAQFAGPLFCHGLDCPAYSVVNTTMLYEIRDYENCECFRFGLGADHAFVAAPCGPGGSGLSELPARCRTHSPVKNPTPSPSDTAATWVSTQIETVSPSIAMTVGLKARDGIGFMR